MTMDFVFGLPLTMTKKDASWVIVDHLTKSVHFLVIRTSYTLQRLVKIYIAEIVQLHDMPISITFDWDPRFTLRL